MTSTHQHNYSSSRSSKKGFSSSGSTANPSRSSSPPLQQHSFKRSNSDHSPSSYTTSSSDGIPDEVFAMFIEDEYKHDSEEEEGNELSESEFFKSSDEEDETSSIEDGFSGWTDQEILKARFSSKVTQELERLSMSKA